MNKQRPVNWVDGMEINAGDFIQSENFFLSAIADSATLALSTNGYGLLPLRSGANPYDGIRVNEQVTGKIEIHLYRCHAITASGFRIDFNADEQGGPLVKNYSPAEDKNLRNRDVRNWDIILSVDPFTRVPAGEPNPEETPPRHPGCDSTYTLYVMPTGDINTADSGRHYLIIGRIRKDGERYVVDSNYIPPSASMSAHPDLMEYFQKFSMMFSGIGKSSRLIMEKIHSRPERGALAENLKVMCGDILRFMAGRYFELRNRGQNAPPADMAGYISSLAHTCYISLISFTAMQKEEMLKYFYEWTDISPGAFEEMMVSMLDMKYEHDSLRAIMVRCEQFMHTFSELWKRMSQLEYIGQHKESIVVSERRRERENNEGTERSWSIMD